MGIPTVAVSGTDITVTYSAPNANNAAIDYYEVYFEHSDGSTYSEITGCADPTGTSCTVTMDNARSTTGYSIDDLIVVKVRAHNTNGFGDYSQVNSSGGTYEDKPQQMDPPSYDTDTSDLDSVDLEWDAPTGITAGGSSVTIDSYLLEWNQGDSTNVWTTLEAATTLTTRSVTGLSDTDTYQFRITATNKYGTGTTVSSTLSYTPTTVPDAPSVTSVTATGSFVKISFAAPTNDNGSAVTAYRIEIREDDSTTDFSEDTTYCDGSDATVISNMFCQIPFTTLTASPFNLDVTEEVVVKVTAQNGRGWGATSSESSGGATIETVPDQMATPTKGTDSDSTQIEVDWSPLSSPANGDSVITSYVLYWD